MQRYFVEENQIINDLITIKGNDVHHIKTVMRMKENCQILCVNKQFVYLCVIESIQDEVLARVLETRQENNELSVDVTIAHGLVRREKTEEVIRRLTELGCMGYIPVEMKRCVVKMKDDKRERQRKIVKEASEQSHRNLEMEIGEVISFKELLKLKDQFDLAMFSHVDEDSQELKKCLTSFVSKRILVVVGPEGGYDPTEITLLKQHGFIGVGLGLRILRTETAPLYLMSVIGYEFGEEV